jgi:hypothetical protein
MARSPVYLYVSVVYSINAKYKNHKNPKKTMKDIATNQLSISKRISVFSKASIWLRVF